MPVKGMDGIDELYPQRTPVCDEETEAVLKEPHKASASLTYQQATVCECLFTGLVVRVPSYSLRSPGFDYRRYQIF
jgi:hypothetical protein